MKLRNSLLITLNLWTCLTVQSVTAQSTTDSFSGKLKSVNRLLEQEFFKGTTATVKPDAAENISGGHFSPAQLLSNVREKEASVSAWLRKTERSVDTISLGDTLVIGVEPGEELVINSEWVHNGPILIIGDGILRFEGAQATIIGDIITAENGQLIADSSSLYFPQEYFYQRMLLLAGNSGMHFLNSTLDFGGMVHTMAAVGTSVLEFDHVDKADFTTFGLYESASIIIDSINKAGEFVVIDSTHLQIRDAATVLLWHQFRDGSVADIVFPDGNSVDSYEFNDQVSGVSGVDYDISLENCTEVMWGMMPSAGSDVTVTNSDIRSVGFWFENSDSTDVNGLVNNSHYSDYTAPLDDRNLHLINCDVMTWSLYSYDYAYVDVSGSILGEIGAMGRSEVQALNYYCDGSGGYVWATDTTFLLTAFSSVSASLRTGGRGVMIFAYSNQMNGLVQALGQSILILLQSNITATPVYDPGAVIWMANITGPGTAYQNSDVPIMGSAWIDKGTESDQMDFGYYEMYYQKEGDTSWQMIGDAGYEEVREDILIHWNTNGLDPGAYYIKEVLVDNLGNSAEASTQIILLPDLLGLPGTEADVFDVKVYPNPVKGTLYLTFELSQQERITLKLFGCYGKEKIILDKAVMDAGINRITVHTDKLPAGIYYLLLQSENNRMVKKIVVL
jgi:hypothetical protein